MTPPIERGGNYVLEFGDTYFEVQKAGGKVIELRRGTGENLFTTSAVNSTNFGATFWTSPQSWPWPPPTALDADDYTVTVDEALGTITMVSEATTDAPLVTVTKVFAANLCDESIDITYTVSNAGTTSVTIAPWEVSRALPEGVSFFPAGSLCATCNNLLTVPIVAVPTGQTDTQYFFYEHGTASDVDKKLFADGTGGWLAWANDTDLYVKKWADVPVSEQLTSEGEAEVEIYAGDGYVELEVQGPSATLTAAPGGTTSFAMKWFVRTLPTGAQPTAGNQALVDGVLSIVSSPVAPF